MYEAQRPGQAWPPSSQAATAHLYLRDAQVRYAWQILTEAFRHLEKRAESDRVASEIGVAHQRVLTLVSSFPCLSVGEVRHKLAVSKQSFNRVMAELISRDMIVVTTDAKDRRIRRLELTDRGRGVTDACFTPILSAMTSAYREAGAQAVEGFQHVLACLVRDAGAPLV